MLIDVRFVGHGFASSEHREVVAGEPSARADVFGQGIHPHANGGQRFGHRKEGIARCTNVVVATASSDQVELGGVRHPRIAQDFVSEMHPHNLREHQLTCAPVISQRLHFDHFAFQLHRRLGHPWGLNGLGIDRCQARLHKLIHARPVIRACQGTRLNHLVVHQVDHHLGHFLNIVPGMLGGAVPSSACW